MDKKISEIAEAFEHLKFEECLNLIDQTLKKHSKAKKNQTLNDTQLWTTKLFKCGCMGNLGQFHEAIHTFYSLIKPQNIYIDLKQHVYLFVAIAQQLMGSEEKIALQIIQKMQMKEKVDTQGNIYRFYLNNNLFSQAGKFYMKNFILTKDPVQQMSHAYLEYLQVISNNKLLDYRYDGIFQEKQINLKLVSMFVDKCFKGQEDSWKNYLEQFNKKNEPAKKIEQQKKKEQQKKYAKIKKAVSQLKIKISLHEGKHQQAIQLYKQNGFQNKFKLFRSLLGLSVPQNQKQTLLSFYLNEVSLIFRKNMNLTEYHPSYDYYDQFLEKMLTKVKQQQKSSLFIPIDKFERSDCYKFEGSPANIISNYFNSIRHEYTYLINQQSPSFDSDSKSDYYRIAIKGLLLQLIKMSVNNQKDYHFYLNQYVRHFSMYLTYISQMQPYSQTIYKEKMLSPIQQRTKDSQIIRHLNYLKLKFTNQKSIILPHKLNDIYQQLIAQYNQQIEKEKQRRGKQLQKGQRYFSDDYIIMIVDLVRLYIENYEAKDQQVEIWALKMVQLLESCIQKSNYNADIKLRYLYFCSILNYTEKIQQSFMENDIKSVQWQTLGYWILNPFLKFRPTEEQKHLMKRMVKSYQQNQRQTSEYAIKALKGLTFDRVEEYLSFRKHINSSYNILVMMTILYRHYHLDEHSFNLLQKIRNRIPNSNGVEGRLTINCDFKVMNNTFEPQKQFCQFYGIFNSPKILHIQSTIELSIKNLTLLISGKKQLEIQKVSLEEVKQCCQKIHQMLPENILDLNNFYFYHEKPHIEMKKGNYFWRNIEKELHLAQKLTVLKTKMIETGYNLVKLTEEKQINEGQLQLVLKQMSEFLQLLSNTTSFMNIMTNREQLKSINSFRITLFSCYNVFNLFLDSIQTTKSFKHVKNATQDTVENCLSQILKQLEDFKLKNITQYDNYVYPKNLLQVEEQIVRMNEMDSKQIKRQIAHYRTAYKN